MLELCLLGPRFVPWTKQYLPHRFPQQSEGAGLLASTENLGWGSGAHFHELDGVAQGQERNRGLEIVILEMQRDGSKQRR